VTVVIRQGDAGAALARVPAGSVKLVITDPPYATLDRGTREVKVYANGLGFRTLGWSTIAKHLGLARRTLRPDGVAMVVVNRTSAPLARAALRAAGFRRLATITWLNGVKLGGDPRTFVAGRRPPPRRDAVVVGLMPSARIGRQRIVRARPVAPATTGRYPTEKPVYLGAALARIAGVRQGHRVIDPYCGSGALLAGSWRLGAHVVGIDRSARAVAIARRRFT
jgi:DNA modification methylase